MSDINMEILDWENTYNNNNNTGINDNAKRVSDETHDTSTTAPAAVVNVVNTNVNPVQSSCSMVTILTTPKKKGIILLTQSS